MRKRQPLLKRQLKKKPLQNKPLLMLKLHNNGQMLKNL
jgi:hypothetical protein